MCMILQTIHKVEIIHQNMLLEILNIPNLLCIRVLNYTHQKSENVNSSIYALFTLEYKFHCGIVEVYFHSNVKIISFIVLQIIIRFLKLLNY